MFFDIGKYRSETNHRFGNAIDKTTLLVVAHSNYLSYKFLWSLATPYLSCFQHMRSYTKTFFASIQQVLESI